MIKVKLEYLNLIINYYYSSEIKYDCYLIDLLFIMLKLLLW